MIRAAWQALVSGPLRSAPGRTLLATLAIAAGIALGVAVHLINASAAAEFGRAALQLAGAADLVVRGPRAGFDETLYPRIATLSGIALASPVLELEASRSGSNESLKIIGLDVLRAWRLQPALIAGATGPAADLFDADAIRLSAAAARTLGVAAGDRLDFQVGTATVSLRVSGVLADGAYRQRLGIMDIAAAQWRFDRIGRLNRIDIRLQPGADPFAVQRALQPLLPPGVHILTPDAESERSAALTRAYRLNLDMLAMIALFTGAFLVFSTQVLALLRRRTQIALLRALGLTRRQILALLMVEGALIGAAGAAIGIAGGYLLAQQLLAHAGVDLGAGYFRMLQADLLVAPGTLAAFLGLGITFAVAGTAVPAWTAARRPPAQGLRAGDTATDDVSNTTVKTGIATLISGAALLRAPPVQGLPLAGYAAIALLLLGSVLVLPQVAAAMLARIRLRLAMPHALGLAQLQATPRHAAISISAILVSFSLVVAMLLMVTSFRVSLDDWLQQVLPADLYLRAAAGGETAYLSIEQQQRIAQIPGIARVGFLRSQNLLLDSGRAPVTLIARDLRAEDTGRTLPLVAAPVLPAPGAPPAIWVSELVADVYGLRPGQLTTLPLGNPPQAWTVAGVWRDYARQNGAIVMDRAAYQARTGDRLANDAALWLRPDATRAAVARDLRAMLGPVEIADAGEIRRRSLAIFDRTFAITWALEIAALVIGLAGVSLAFSAQALARRREFGVLRHLGMTRREIGLMLAGEGAVTAAIGALCGLATGSVIGLVLIQVINRQSFHWSMDLAVPWLALPALFLSIVTCAALTATLSARFAMRQDVVHAVREDW